MEQIVAKIGQVVKYIDVPPYEEIFNGSIIADTQGYLLSFRKDDDHLASEQKSYLGLARLDNQFNLTQDTLLDAGEKAEDARLFSLSGQSYIAYNDIPTPGSKRRMFLAQLDRDTLTAHDFIDLDWPAQTEIEKNWSPFTYNRDIYFIYSVEPHIILMLNEETRKVEKAFESSSQLNWDYGELRGGTPAIFVSEYDAYLTFAHSSKIIDGSMTYFMTAYLFEKDPPFKIIALATNPIGFPGIYSEAPRYENKRVLFPCGVVDEKDSFLLAAGYNDFQTILIRIGKTDLKKILAAVSP